MVDAGFWHMAAAGGGGAPGPLPHLCWGTPHDRQLEGESVCTKSKAAAMSELSITLLLLMGRGAPPGPGGGWSTHKFLLRGVTSLGCSVLVHGCVHTNGGMSVSEGVLRVMDQGHAQ